MDRVAHAIPMDMAQALFGHGSGVALISMWHQGSCTRPFAIHWFMESYDMIHCNCLIWYCPLFTGSMALLNPCHMYTVLFFVSYGMVQCIVTMCEWEIHIAYELPAKSRETKSTYNGRNLPKFKSNFAIKMLAKSIGSLDKSDSSAISWSCAIRSAPPLMHSTWAAADCRLQLSVGRGPSTYLPSPFQMAQVFHPRPLATWWRLDQENSSYPQTFGIYKWP